MSQSMIHFLAVFIGGGCGTLFRFYVVFKFTHSVSILSSSVATMSINIVGCFLIGILHTLLTHYMCTDWLKLLLISGVLGGFTTFSTFGLDAVMMMQTHQASAMLMYLLVSVFGGLGAVWCGIYLTNRWLLF